MLFAAPLLEAQGQGMFNIGGMAAAPIHNASPVGGGGTVGFYYDLTQQKQYTAANAVVKPFHFSIGAEAEFASLGQRNFDGITLPNPQQGQARVQFQNAMYAYNGAFRVSCNLLDGKILPYADLLAGYRYLTSDTKLFPNDEDLRTSQQRLATVRGFNAGIAAGAMVKLSKICYLNLGIEVNHCIATGQSVDLSKLERTESGITYTMRPAAQNYGVAKAGIILLLDFRKTDEWRRSFISYLNK